MTRNSSCRLIGGPSYRRDSHSRDRLQRPAIASASKPDGERVEVRAIIIEDHPVIAGQQIGRAAGPSGSSKVAIAVGAAMRP